MICTCDYFIPMMCTQRADALHTGTQGGLRTGVQVQRSCLRTRAGVANLLRMCCECVANDFVYKLEQETVALTTYVRQVFFSFPFLCQRPCPRTRAGYRRIYRSVP